MYTRTAKCFAVNPRAHSKRNFAMFYIVNTCGPKYVERLMICLQYSLHGNSCFLRFFICTGRGFQEDQAHRFHSLICKKQINGHRRNFGKDINNQRLTVFFSRSYMKQTKRITWRTEGLPGQKFNHGCGSFQCLQTSSQRRRRTSSRLRRLQWMSRTTHDVSKNT